MGLMTSKASKPQNRIWGIAFLHAHPVSSFAPTNLAKIFLSACFDILSVYCTIDLSSFLYKNYYVSSNKKISFQKLVLFLHRAHKSLIAVVLLSPVITHKLW